MELIDDKVAPTEHFCHYLIYHVAENEGVLLAQPVDKIRNNAHYLNMAELFEELRGQIRQIYEPLRDVLVAVKWRFCRVCQVLHYSEGHLVQCQVLADADRLNLRFNLILVGLGIGDHLIKRDD